MLMNFFFKLLEVSTTKVWYMDLGIKPKHTTREWDRLLSPHPPHTAYAPSMYAQIVSRLQKSEEQLNATKVELTLMKEEFKQTKMLLLGLNLAFGSSDRKNSSFKFITPSVRFIVE